MQVGDTVWAAVPDWWDFWENFSNREPQQGQIEEVKGTNKQAAVVNFGHRKQGMLFNAVVDMTGPPPWKREPILFPTKEEAEAAQERWRKPPTTIDPKQ